MITHCNVLDKKHKLICQKCNKEFTKNKHAKIAYFCNDCRYINCIICSEKIKLNTNQLQSGKAKYCSHKCEKFLSKGRFFKNGYVCVKSNHPKNYEGYYYEHLLIMENHINRYLEDNEIVHHKDGNRANNQIENLELMTRSEHGKLHLPAKQREQLVNNSNNQGISLERGYIRIWRPEHPMARKNGYVFAHRLIMSEHIGRYLTKSEIIHHKNGNRQDNRIENLEILSHKEHIYKHLQ